MTADGSWAAHFEHTFTLTPDGAWVLTALDGGEAGADRPRRPVRGALTTAVTDSVAARGRAWDDGGHRRGVFPSRWRRQYGPDLGPDPVPRFPSRCEADERKRPPEDRRHRRARRAPA